MPDRTSRTPRELAEQAHFGVLHAQTLAREARLLLDHGHAARAYVLASIAGEECGKAAAAFIVVNPDWIVAVGLSEKMLVADLRAHHFKVYAARMLYDLLVQGKPLEQSTFTSAIDAATHQIDRRFRALYVDYRDGALQVPSDDYGQDAIDLLDQVDGFIAALSADVGDLDTAILMMESIAAEESWPPDLMKAFAALGDAEDFPGALAVLGRLVQEIEGDTSTRPD